MFFVWRHDMSLPQADAAMRSAVSEIEGECRRRGIPASDFSFSLNDAGTWVVNYFTPVRGNCICRCDDLPGIYDALQAHIAHLIEDYGDDREPPPQMPRKEQNTVSTGGFAGKVKERDGACVECGATSTLHAHHIKPKALHPELAKDPDNGVTLCAKHHRQAHGAAV